MPGPGVGTCLNEMATVRRNWIELGVLSTTVVVVSIMVWRLTRPSRVISKNAQRKAKWVEEKKQRKAAGKLLKAQRKNADAPGPSRTLWTVPEAEALSAARLPEASRVAPALLPRSRSHKSLFEANAETTIKNGDNGDSKTVSGSTFIYVLGGRLRGRTLTTVCVFAYSHAAYNR